MGASLRDGILIKKVQEIANENNWTDAQTAEVIGVHRGAWCDIQKGRRPIGKIVYARILARLCLKEDEVFRPELPTIKTQPEEDMRTTEKVLSALLDIRGELADIQKRIRALENHAKPTGAAGGAEVGG